MIKIINKKAVKYFRDKSINWIDIKLVNNLLISKR